MHALCGCVYVAGYARQRRRDGDGEDGIQHIYTRPNSVQFAQS